MTNYNDYIELLKDKDDEAFTFIYNETKHAVYAMIVSIVKDRDISQDLMQDTYITMLEKINQYQPNRSFLNWLLVIARNKAIDYYRKKKREVLIDQNDNEVIFPNVSPSGERNVLIDDMLNHLSEIERTIFLLKIVEDLKSIEIAKILNLPLGTVLWHYNKAIKKIKKL